MQFNVAQLLKEPTGGTRKYDLDEPLDDLDPQLVIQAPIRGQVKFTKIPQGILATGGFQTVVELNCNRCLEPFDEAVSFDLEEQFRPKIDLQTGAVLPQEEDADEATQISEQNILDLSEVMRQELLISLPAAATCRDDCAGLCPHCGKNLNEGACDCSDDTLDPRWASLRDLLGPDGSLN